MPCYYPVHGWRSAEPNYNGKHTIVFTKSGAQLDCPVRLPCGRCIGCRLDRSRDWALRCVHESKLHDENAFLTLTFSDEYLPEDGSIRKEDLRHFYRRLRERTGQYKIGYFGCGEYGEQLGRPHYHSIIFGYNFDDRKPFKKINENTIYTSEFLQDLWPYGHASIGEVNFQTAAYVARYQMKKINGPQQKEHYQGKEPEFVTMSRRPSIGQRWFEKYKTDCLKGYLTQDGKKYPLPKFYEKLWYRWDDGSYAEYKANRALHFDPMDPEQMIDRLEVKEQVKKNRIKILSRSLDNV